jgi:hypothetical protein
VPPHDGNPRRRRVADERRSLEIQRSRMKDQNCGIAGKRR